MQMDSSSKSTKKFNRKMSAPGDIWEVTQIKKRRGLSRKKSLTNSLLKYEAKTEDLRKTFNQVSESEKLIYDCSCALQKDILYHGRLYVCLTGFYFHTNVFRKDTQLILKWTDITTLKRSKTAKLIPNAILASTESDQFFLTSFTMRDKVFLIMTRLWQLALKCCEMPMSEVNLWTQYYYSEDLSFEDHLGTQSILNKRNFQNKIQNQLKLLQQQQQQLSEEVEETIEEIHPTDDGKQEDDRGQRETDPDGMNLLEVPVASCRVVPPNDSQSDDVETNSYNSDSRDEKKDSVPKSRSSSPLLKLRMNSLFPLKRHRSRSFEDVKNRLSKNDIKRSSSKVGGKGRVTDIQSISKDSLQPITFKVPQELPDVVVSDEQPSEESGSYSDGVCQCGRHEDLLYLMADDVYPMSAIELFKKIFHHTNFWSKFLKVINAKDVVLTPWSKGRDKSGAHVRNISYTLSLNYPFSPKHSTTTEKQVLHPDSNPGEFYLVDTECINNDLPYGEDFYIANRYCISKISEDKCQLRITSQIKYKKKVWGLVKSFIEKNATSGIMETFNIMGNLLRQEANPKDRDGSSGPAANSPAKKKVLIKRSLEKVVGGSKQASSDENQEVEGSAFGKPASTVMSQTSVFVKRLVDGTKKKQDQKWILNMTFGHAVQMVTAFTVFLCLFNIFLYCKLWALESAATKFGDQFLSEKEDLSSYEEQWMEDGEVKMEQWRDIMKNLAEVMEEMARRVTQLKQLVGVKVQRSDE